MRAGNARPYELKSVPTKTVAIRTTGNCAILVQELRLHSCLPLEGKVPAEPTDEVFSNPCGTAAHLNYSLFIRRRSLRV